jgi:putative DNA primase/helicase
MKDIKMFDRLPAVLREKAGFLLWRYEEVKGRTTKVPYSIRGIRADATKRSSYSQFPIVSSVYAKGGYDGIGIFIDRTFSAVDIDDCIEDGNISDLAKDIIERLDSYTETSPSGKGIRILIDTSGVEYDRAGYYVNNRKIGVEVYTQKKFVSVTGNAIREKPIRICGGEFISFMDEYMAKPVPETRKVEVPGSCLSDESVLDKAMTAVNGEKFRKLWEGDITGYPSHSEAELALCSMLAFYCGGDMEQIDRIYRNCVLCGPKWERDDYRTRTLEKAVSGLKEFYRPVATDSAFVDFNDTVQKLIGLETVDNRRYSADDIGFGRLFADVFKDIARFVPERRKWFVFDGRRWQADSAGLLIAELGKDLSDGLLVYASTIRNEDKRTLVLNWCRKWVQRKNRDVYIREAQSVYPLSIEAFDTRLNYFNCCNCTLDLATGESHPHRAEDFITKMTRTSYDPSAVYPRWNSFIDEIMSGDKEKVRFLQKSRGYALSGGKYLECAFFDYGETSRNGKGTMAESVLRVMGEFGVSVRPETIEQKNQSNSHAPSEDVARLMGIRYAVMPEPKKGMVLNSALFKAMSGNDTLNARFLNENSFDFRPQHALYVNTNYLPVINDMTVFESGRVVIIPFDRHFSDEEQDKGLKTEFANPKVQSAILNWLVEGYRMLKAEGLSRPESVKKAIDSYYYDSNKTARFVEERLIADADEEERTSAVYDAYRDWCGENGCHAENCRNFLSELRKFCEIARKSPKDKGEKTTLLVGYKLRKELFP